MFENLFTYTKVVIRHREGPLADARERFPRHCSDQAHLLQFVLRLLLA
jgi:hypothetical protein